MKIAYFEIQNFRKLKSCRLELGSKETVLVGANNSGKTSAMEALILFLKKDKNKEITTTDFTLSNWMRLNQIGEEWIKSDVSDFKQTAQLEQLGEADLPSLYVDQWRSDLPAIDIWLEVEDSEIHYVSHLIPTLSWAGGKIGVRLILEPKVNNDQQIETLYREFRQAYLTAEQTIATSKEQESAKLKESDTPRKYPKLWPQSIREFLDKKLHTYFSVNAYLLDPSKLEDPENGVAQPQVLSENAFPISQKPFDGLFKVDVINAQRGFSDVNSSDAHSAGIASLSSQFRSYYDNHLNPSELPEAKDIEALSVISEAKEKFDEKLKFSFESAISELEHLGYPGFVDPKILITSHVNPIEGLDHESAVQFSVGSTGKNQIPLTLPEKYNGLGYQNLVSMVFKLIRFRDEWVRFGKADKRLEKEGTIIEPLHLVLIEEPEAHLHAQVQQVFIKNAYNVLRKRKELGEKEKLITQMVVSTHSSHIAHEIDFSDLRYFQRNTVTNKNEVPCASLVNLSETFGDGTDTAKFVTRYLKTTHCDLFFADAVILVEGPVERMLVPYFIKNDYPELNSRYVTILEIGGSHAHRLKPLIEALGIFCLVITDLDSVEKPDKGKAVKKQPERIETYQTSNDTLKKWCPCKTNLIEVMDLSCSEKVTKNGLIRVAYQCPILVNFKVDGEKVEAIPYTFEDALVFSNIELFRGLDENKGLLKKMIKSLSLDNVQAASKSMFDALGKSAKKAEMALELLYLKDPNELSTPNYISEGLTWLQCKLEIKASSSVKAEVTENGEAYG
jgi:predicted ATP-dependent endonuclease of OLD family